MDIKLAATDLDGTLISSDGETVSSNNLDAMRRAISKGIYVVPATGRSFFEIPSLLREEQLCTHCICSNGAVITEKSGKVLWESTFSPELAKKIFDILSGYDTAIEIYANGLPTTEKSKMNKASYEYYRIEENYHEVIKKTRKGVENLGDFLDKNSDRAEMFDVFFHDENERREAFQIIGAMEEVELTTSMQSNMEILQRSVNKGSALERLCKMLGVKKEQALAIGDSKNDLTLLASVGLPLAAGNACGELKKSAAHIICSNDESTFAYAMENFAKI